MNELNWMDEIQWQDFDRPMEELANEEVYTLRISDFLQMPDVDFKWLSTVDPYIRALMN